MAFSQVETVPSLGIDSVLRDRNRQDVCFRVLVKDRVRNFTPFDSSSSDENSQSRRIDSWIETARQPDKDCRLLRSAGRSRSKQGDGSSNCAKNTPQIVKNDKKDSGRPENSDPCRSDNDNLGASSLVQIWEARVNKSNGGDAASQSKSTVISSRSSSDASTVDSDPTVQENKSNGGNAANPIKSTVNSSLICSGVSTVDSDLTVQVNKSNGGNAVNQSRSTVNSSRSNSDRNAVEDSCPIDEESNPTLQIESKVSSVDGERVKVADIVRTLSTDQKKPNNKGAKELSRLQIQRPPPISSSQSSSPSDPTVEIKSFSLVCPSPRLRGRQAFSDLLMQMERDRHKEQASLLERHAVSAFPKRGRLQSMLRLRSLQRCVAIQDRQRSNSKPTGPNRFSSESAVSQPRDKIGTNLTDNATELNRCSSPESQLDVNSTVAVPSGSEKPADGCLDSQETSVSNQKDKTPSTIPSNFVENKPKIDEADEKTRWCPFFGASETMSSVRDSCKNQEVEEDEEPALMNCWEEEYDDQENYYYEDANYDWFGEICRPRSYWEDLRKYRYLEVINTRSENEEICRLLERRTVSDFLESEMREKIDRLMASRSQTQFVDEGNQEQHLDRWEIAKEEKIEMEEEEEENGNSCGYDSSQSSSQTFLPSPGRSWSSIDPDIRSAPTLPMKHPSSEMELINNLREHMELLQQEILELRKSVKTCTDMNLQLQQSVNRVNPLKRKCCLCKETRVEALFYRCGHICTCMKCGNELQWNSGKCPICRASIHDVVRVFLDSTDHVKTNSSSLTGHQ